MSIHLDTSLLVDALCVPFRSLSVLQAVTLSAERTTISTPVLFEWLRGPRLEYELAAQEQFITAPEVTVFDGEAARIAARLYRLVRRPRGREMDVAIAACAIADRATLWTLNPADFEDVPGLTLYRP